MSDILGLPGAVFWLWVSAVFYWAAVGLFWRPFSKEKSELMSAFFAFLAGMAVFHTLLGTALLKNNLLLIHLGALAALTGAAYTLKFPLSLLTPSLKKPLFYLALAVGWLIVAWMLVFPHDTAVMFQLTLGYMIVTSGAIAGPYIIWRGLKAKESGVRIKCIGGGVSVVTCCLIADSMVLLGGVSVLGEIFMSVAPVILIVAVYVGRGVQKTFENQRIAQPAL